MQSELKQIARKSIPKLNISENNNQNKHIIRKRSSTGGKSRHANIFCSKICCLPNVKKKQHNMKIGWLSRRLLGRRLLSRRLLGRRGNLDIQRFFIFGFILSQAQGCGRQQQYTVDNEHTTKMVVDGAQRRKLW